MLALAKNPNTSDGLMQKLSVRRLIVFGAAVLWLFSVMFGMKLMMTHETDAGPRAQPHTTIEPSALSTVQSFHSKPYSIVMFAHPHCVCTKASLAELRWLAEQCSERAQIITLFVKPEGAPDDWLDAENCRLAQAIPGATVQTDERATLARTFGAMTSGHVFLINREGAILFSGGITQARGVEGESDGRRAIYTLTTETTHDERRANLVETNVFGCLLY